MTIRTLLSVGVTIAVSGSCTVPSTAEDHAALVPHCRDPSTDCTHTNGTGVYVAEGGVAGIDTFRLLITHFINEGSSVSFDGHYYDAASQQWAPVVGHVVSAEYQSSPLTYQVLAVSETDTVPVWKLQSPRRRAPMYVTDQQLLDLKLHIFAPITSHRYVLEFVKRYTYHDESLPGTPPKPSVHAYTMRWRNPMNTTVQAVDYCFADGEGTDPDPVVFQQGIDVDPENGEVTRNTGTAGFVTMSCLRGAPATVYRWGYGYREPSPLSYFAAGIHMKRASYCADEHHYTTAGTPITIVDDQGINHDPIERLEAVWNEHGAMCLDHRRHPEIEFLGCNDNPLPSCENTVGKMKNGF